MTLLIVDDDITTIDLIKSTLDLYDLGIDKVYEAYNGEKAKEIVTSEHPDIILCDIEMPLCNGIELLKWLRHQGLDTQFLFLSCYDKFEYAQEGIEYGLSAYLTKPFSVEKLNKTLTKAITAAEGSKNKESSQIAEDFQEISISSKAGSQIVSKVKTYIEHNYMENLSRNALAKVVYVSPNYLSRIFSAEVGMSMREYANSMRIREAKRLLRSTSMSISEIGGQVGFDSASYFSTVFFRHTGMSPVTWRAKGNKT